MRPFRSIISSIKERPGIAISVLAAALTIPVCLLSIPVSYFALHDRLSPPFDNVAELVKNQAFQEAKECIRNTEKPCDFGPCVAIFTGLRDKTADFDARSNDINRMKEAAGKSPRCQISEIKPPPPTRAPILKNVYCHSSPGKKLAADLCGDILLDKSKLYNCLSLSADDSVDITIDEDEEKRSQLDVLSSTNANFDIQVLVRREGKDRSSKVSLRDMSSLPWATHQFVDQACSLTNP